MAEVLRQVWYAGLYYFARYALRKRYLTRKIHDYRLRLDLRYPGLSRQVLISGTREEQLKAVLERELRPGNTVLDLGANIGYYTSMMGKLIGPKGMIYAIEPEPRNFKLLAENIALNGLQDRVEARNVAAGEKNGKARFYVSEFSNLHTMLPISKDGRMTPGIREDSFIEVDTVDPSDFLKGKRPIDLIRMDIEGFEVEVINGLERAIRSGEFSGKIVFEAHFPKYTESHSMKRTLQMLFGYGYHVTSVTSNDESKTRLKERGYRPSAVFQTADDRFQGVYGSLSDEDAIFFIAEVGGIRDVVLAKTGSGSGKAEAKEQTELVRA
jgi:FkbM family methyltransferase